MPPDVLELRRYRDADADAVRDLHRRALHAVDALPDPGPWDQDLRRIREAYLDAGGEFLVGEIDGRIVAMGALKRTGPTEAEIKRMRVDPDHWRRGIGRAMLEALEAAARAAGLRRLTLDTTTRQTAAQAMYEAHGYRRTGRRRFDERFTLILYEKRLGD